MMCNILKPKGKKIRHFFRRIVGFTVGFSLTRAPPFRRIKAVCVRATERGRLTDEKGRKSEREEDRSAHRTTWTGPVTGTALRNLGISANAADQHNINSLTALATILYGMGYSTPQAPSQLFRPYSA